MPPAGVRAGRGSATTLTTQDARTLANSTVAPDIRAVAPTMSDEQSIAVGDTNWTTSVIGTTPSWLQVRARSVALGRFLTAEVDGVLFRAVLDSDVRINPGDQLSLVPKPDRIRWFDAETSLAA